MPARKLRAATSPNFVEPQLCLLVTAPPSAPGWVHEYKYDGYRMQLRLIDGGANAHADRSRLDGEISDDCQGSREDPRLICAYRRLAVPRGGAGITGAAYRPLAGCPSGAAFTLVTGLFLMASTVTRPASYSARAQRRAAV